MLCEICGQNYRELFVVPDEIWSKVSAEFGGLDFVCLVCFESTAKSMGLWLRWRCEDAGLPWREKDQDETKRITLPKKEKLVETDCEPPGEYTTGVEYYEDPGKFRKVIIPIASEPPAPYVTRVVGKHDIEDEPLIDVENTGEVITDIDWSTKCTNIDWSTKCTKCKKVFDNSNDMLVNVSVLCLECQKGRIMNNWQPGTLEIVFVEDGFNITSFDEEVMGMEDLLHDFLLPYVPQNAKVIKTIGDLIGLEDYNKALNLLEDLEQRIGTCGEIIRLHTIIAMEKDEE